MLDDSADARGVFVDLPASFHRAGATPHTQEIWTAIELNHLTCLRGAEGLNRP